MSEAKYKTSYKVRIADANEQAKLKIPSLFEMLQEVATEHAQKLGVDFSALAPKGLGWALAKLSIEINKLPSWNERVHITTWPSVRERIATYREFCAKDANEQILFTARSQWILFDINTRRIVRLEQLHDWNLCNEFANDEKFDEPLQRPKNNVFTTECNVRNNDIDLNGHVNNSIYVVWAMQSLSTDFLEKRIPQKIKINFLEEVKLGQNVKSVVETCQSKTLHSIINVDTNKECARLNIQWL